MRKTVFYNDDQTRLRTAYLKEALQRDLISSDTVFIDANRHQFTRAIELNPAAIFIAENIGATSHHMRDIHADSIKELRNYAYHGGTLVFFGGASHYAMTEITWHWDNGTVVYKGAKDTFSLVHGKLIGPHHRFPLSPDDEINYNGCFKVPLIIHERANQLAIENCWQGNCGNFVINDNRIAPGYQVLAEYAQKTGIAAINIPIGRKGGNIILCSVMPHYNRRELSPLWDKILTIVEGKISRIQPQLMLKPNP